MANKATIITDPDPIFGKLTWDSIPFHDPIIITTALVVMMIGAGVVGAILYYGKLRYLWDEWLTSVDHKKIGIMYIICLLYTSPSPRDLSTSRMPSSA